MRRSPRTRLFAASAALAATLGLAACGDDDDDAGEADVTLDTVTEVTIDDTEVTIDDTEVTIDTVETDGTDGSTPGGGEVGTQDDYIEAAREEVSSEFEDQDLADCVGEAMINDDVYAAIEETGLTVEEFSDQGPSVLQLDEAVAEQVGADFAACGNLTPEIIAEGAALDCAEENVTEEQVAAFLAYSLLEVEPTAEVRAAIEAADACIEAATTTTS